MHRSDVRMADLGRFSLSNTSETRRLMVELSQSAATPEDIQRLCKLYADADAVPWKLIEYVFQQARRGSDPSSAVDPTISILKGSQLVFSSPPVRQRSKQLEERLATLQHMVDQQEYAAMVADVTVHEQQAAAAASDPLFPNTRLQLSFGLHVIVTMGTFFALGFYAGRFLFKDQAWAAIMGAAGLAAGLLLETTLLIIRTNLPAPLEDKYAHLLDKKWDQKQSWSKPEVAKQQRPSAIKHRQSKQHNTLDANKEPRSQVNNAKKSEHSNSHMKDE